jgi:hypothetical protein
MSEPRTSLILTHGQPHPGREHAAVQLQARFLTHVRELRAAGRVDDARAYILTTGATAERKGVLVVEGARDAIEGLFWSKEWKTLVAQASALAANVQLDFAVGGDLESLSGPASLYAAAIHALDAS